MHSREITIIAALVIAAAACFWRGLTPDQPTAQPVVATTPVSLSPPRVVEQRIETIRVGQRVWVGENPSSELDLRFGDDVVCADWRLMKLRAPKRGGGHAEVEMLRPAWWLEEHGVRAGGEVDIEVPECGIEGRAKVLGVGPCPPIPPGPGRVVTATFHHQAAATIDVAVEGLAEPIGATPNHPFWSETEQRFVRADQLRPGEEVRTLHGTTRVASVSTRGPPEPVYNLEVHAEHVYRVGAARLLVHNGNPCAAPLPDPRKRPGYDPGDIHQDHPVARSLGGDPDVTRPFPAASNLRKGGLEGELRRYEEYLRRNTDFDDETIRSVIQSEIDGLARDVIASPFGKVFPGGAPPSAP
ncbi:hypothetical protein Pla175_19800 [Pirellulimonas nuda]|uniref:Intein C-terminal splicing domain-containing protein n=1 Tax=Pirellulimonas nuda TaxID=2528009 RepID=A0A518DAU1_9BACT|nr:Hint domain-containing protein [Pirellulimonas nuda]QDU88600.1 hypothetical protein Pla175_19800 [Pirellulimonas nuda]